jgi:hypothetical protein
VSRLSLLAKEKEVIEFLFFVGLVAEVGVVRSSDGDQIDFGPGSNCMFTLPPGFLVDAAASDEWLIRFDNREKDEKKYVWGSARVLEDVDVEERLKQPNRAIRAYKNATIENAVVRNGDVIENAFEVVIGRQVIRFASVSDALIPKPEDVVDACGPAK